MEEFKSFQEYWDSRIEELNNKYTSTEMNFLYDECLNVWDVCVNNCPSFDYVPKHDGD